MSTDLACQIQIEDYETTEKLIAMQKAANEIMEYHWGKTTNIPGDECWVYEGSMSGDYQEIEKDCVKAMTQAHGGLKGLAFKIEWYSTEPQYIESNEYFDDDDDE